jgi:RNA recognition motif-containing protein
VKIYVGGLPLSVNEEGLKTIFSAYGDVASVNLVKDGVTGESRGFGFVEIPEREQAEKAIEEMAGQEMEGHALTVERARERARPIGGGRGGFGKGGGNRRGGGRGRS